MGAITISGYNNIDFNALLEAVMYEERAPLRTLQTQRASLESQRNTFATLATKLAALEATVDDLAGGDAFSGSAISVSDSTAISLTAGTAAATGSYEVVVNELARSQVTATTSVHADKDTTVVATGGAILINGVTVNVGAPVTLQALADAINRTPDVGVVASIVRAAGAYQLVLTASRTGRDNAFTVTNSLTGGAGVAFSATNAVDATDADVLVNNIRVTSDTNTIEDAIPGVTLTVARKDPGVPITVSIARDTEATRARIAAFVSAYNDLVHFFTAQNASAGTGEASSIGRDAVVRALRASLREVVSRSFAGGGRYSYLSQIGVEFTRSGDLALDDAVFDEAVRDHPVDLEQLFQGPDGRSGVFGAVLSIIGDYTDADGLVPGAQSRLDVQMRNLDTRMASLEARLAVRQRMLQIEYDAADAAMTQLNYQMSSLSALGSEYQLF